MKFLEKDLETIIFEADNSVLQSRGLDINGKKIRQLYLGNYGRCDLIAYFRQNGALHVTIYELKQEKIDISAVHQIIKYRHGVISFLKQRNRYFNAEVNAVLIGNDIDKKSTFPLLLNQVGWLSAYTYNYEIDGLKFELVPYLSLVDEGFYGHEKPKPIRDTMPF